MSESKCDRREKTPIHPEKKCCFNCSRSGSDCDVWHTCGDDCPGWKKEDTVQQETGTDYKELIERLRKYGGLPPIAKDAATAIETLLAEREAAVKDLAKRPHPSTCKYGEHCDYVSAITGRPDCYSCDEWQWRSPQKEGGGNGGRTYGEGSEN